MSYDEEELNSVKTGVFLVGLIILILFIISTIFGWFYTVQPWEVSFEKTFGKINPTINAEGLYFKAPWVTNAIKMNTRNIVVSAKESAASKDVQIVTTEVAINFSLQWSSAVDLYTTIWNERAITETVVGKAIQESIKAATSKFTATESITKREEVRLVMIENLEAKLNPRGIIINQVDITDFSFSPEFDRAIEQKVTAEQNALQSKAVVEKIKYEAEQAIAKAKWEAEAVRINAIAEAEAIRIKAESIMKQWGKDYIELQRINKWNWVLPSTMLSDWANTFINLK